MNLKTEKETNILLQAFEDTDIEADVKSAQMEDPKENLGQVMLSFFNDRLTQITESTNFKKKVRDALEKKIEANEIRGDSLAKLLVSLEEQDSIRDASVFALLRPNNGSSNPLLSSFTKKAEGLTDSNGNNKLMDGANQRSVDQLYRLLQKVEQMEKDGLIK